jgi:hypothetical protein
MTSTILFKCGKNDGIVVYLPKEMAPKIESVKPAFFFTKSRNFLYWLQWETAR